MYDIKTGDKERPYEMYVYMEYVTYSHTGCMYGKNSSCMIILRAYAMQKYSHDKDGVRTHAHLRAKQLKCFALNLSATLLSTNQNAAFARNT